MHFQRRRCVGAHAQKSRTSHPFEGAGPRREARLPPARRGAARSRLDPGRGTRYGAGSCATHNGRVAIHTRDYTRPPRRRLDTFNCHVNLFVPLPIEGGRALSRELSPRRAPRPVKNLARRARGRRTMGYSRGDDSSRKVAPISAKFHRERDTADSRRCLLSCERSDIFETSTFSALT